METELLIARINDTAELSLKTSKPKFFGFLSGEQAVLADKILQKRRCNFEFFGGYDNAERVYLGCFTEWDKKFNFPIGSLTFKYRTTDKLSHRDFLGCLTSLGLKREAIGDILVGDGKTVIFVSADIKDYIKSQVTKIGRTGVTVSEGYSLPLPIADRLESFSDIIASARLDCIVSALTGLSRSRSEAVISEGLVTVNSVVCNKATKNVTDGDVLSIRKKGRFIITSSDGRTKKNKVIINYKKYI